MNIAKDKAEELRNQMKNCLYSDGLYDAKQCALICVNEIIEEFKLMVPEPYKQHYKFWENVKEELKLL